MKRLLCPACAEELDEPACDVPEDGMTLDPEEDIVCSNCGIDLPCTPIEMPTDRENPLDLPYSARVKVRKCYRKKKRT
jgi:hypothetical protein